jgi:hypothetical protein
MGTGFALRDVKRLESEADYSLVSRVEIKWHGTYLHVFMSS